MDWERIWLWFVIIAIIIESIFAIHLIITAPNYNLEDRELHSVESINISDNMTAKCYNSFPTWRPLTCDDISGFFESEINSYYWKNPCI